MTYERYLALLELNQMQLEYGEIDLEEYEKELDELEEWWACEGEE